MLSRKKPVKEESAPDTIVGPNSQWEGNLTCQGSVFVNGSLKGAINVSGRMVVGPEGRVEAEVKAGSARVSGQVIGNIFVEELLEVNSTGKIMGEIHSDMISVAEGGVVDGHFNMSTREDRAALDDDKDTP